jgi:hypothetical protein
VKDSFLAVGKGAARTLAYDMNMRFTCKEMPRVLIPAPREPSQLGATLYWLDLEHYAPDFTALNGSTLPPQIQRLVVLRAARS